MKPLQANKTSTPFKSSFAVNLLVFTATTALLCTRDFIGLKRLPIWKLQLLIAILIPCAVGTEGPAFAVITIQTLALGIVHILQNNKKLLKGKIIVDPFSLGTSRFAGAFPKSFSTAIVQRWFDPAICCLMGCFFFWKVSWGLGVWMILSGLSLFLLELAVQKACARTFPISLTNNA